MTTGDRELFLLGAGASKDAGVPTSYELSKEIVNYWPDEADNDESIAETVSGWRSVYRFVAGGLAFQSGIKGHDPFSGVDVEAMFNAIDALARREVSEVSPFIAGWHPVVNQFERPSEDDIRKVDLRLRQEIYAPIELSLREAMKGDKSLQTFSQFLNKNLHSWRSDWIGSGFSTAFRQAVNGPDFVESAFSNAASAMQAFVQILVWVEDASRVDYLRALVRYCSHRKLAIATLNYDNTIELAAATEGLRVDTGLSAWETTAKFEFSEDAIPLLKLHGSIDWKSQRVDPSDDRPIAFERVVQVPVTSKSDLKHYPAMIFGHRNKLTVEGPFPALLRAFIEKLEETDLLTVIGYSFRDDHINSLITAWMNNSSCRKLRIVNGPNFTRKNIPFHNSDNEELLKGRITVHSKYAAEWIAATIASAHAS